MQKNLSNTKRLIFIAVAAWVLVLSAGTVALGASSAGYNIKGSFDSQSSLLTVDVAVENVDAVAGRVALDYDGDKLQLITGATLSETVQNTGNSVVTDESYKMSELVSENEGYVMFAWYASGNSVPAINQKKSIATIKFKVLNGSVSNFDNNTIDMLYVNDKGCANYDTALTITSMDKVFYKNNVDGAQNCNLSFDYPGSDTPATAGQKVKLTIMDTANNSIQTSNIMIGYKEYSTNSSGNIETSLVPGKYAYTIESSGFGTKTGTLTVGSNGLTETIYLRRNADFVQDIADNLAITFAKGDSADFVTRSLGLPFSGPDKTTITWTSSNPSVITATGTVFRNTQSATVTLTAIVKKDSIIVTKQFVLKVAAKSTPIPGDSGSITFDPTKPIGPDNQPPERFTDLSSVPWAKDAILALAEINVINGVSEYNFAPNDSILRCDFITLLMRMLNPTGTPGESFTDVSKNAYYYDEVTLAKALGIAGGVGDNRFQPTATISRQEMMAMTYRALVTLGYLDETKASESTLQSFSDRGQISSFAQDAIAKLVNEGLIQGDDSKINPTGKTTRAEVAVFLYRILLKY